MFVNINDLAAGQLVPKEKPPEDVEDDRHQRMLMAIAPYSKQTIQKNVTPVYIDYKTRKTKLVLVMCPIWSPWMPPFNLARLSGVAKSAGYETHIIDLNVRAYNLERNIWKPYEKGEPSLWNNSVNWWWRDEKAYLEKIQPKIQPMLLDAVSEILKLEADIVGFTIYDVSEQVTKWLCKELKSRKPQLKIVVGGSQVHKSWFDIQPYYNYVVNGEGEQALLNVLDEVENGIEHNEPQYIKPPEDLRLNLNGLPMPDYESIDFSQYEIPNGVNTEISRGCTAKCTFCEETHFWKYRQRQAVDLIQEIEWLYYNKGTDLIWFIDSLVNGNLKELRAFCKAVAIKQLKIRWTGYARCDGRMDLDYYKDLKDGGCIMLSYGIESGSQKVLDDMAKGVTIQEMEQNFRHGKEVGIYASTNWIIGFPTETPSDFSHSMIFLWRMRNMNIHDVGAGQGFGLSPEGIVGQNPDRFNLSYHKYQGFWITKDFSLGGTHVMIRVKSFYMFLDLLKGCTEKQIQYPVRLGLAAHHYKINFDDPTCVKEIEYENFDYQIIKPNINPFANTLVNEIWPLLRMLWRTRGGYKLELLFNPTIDLNEFGGQFGPGMFTAVYKFEINEQGVWDADFDFKFEQVDNPYDERKPPPYGRKGPFYAQDYSRIMSNTAIRARRLAKPNWSIETGRDDRQFDDLLLEEVILNQTTDFSFTYHFKGSGNWGLDNFDIAVPGKSKNNIIPIKVN